MADDECVMIQVMFSDDNLYLISPNRTYRDGDTIYTDITVTGTETGGFVARGIPQSASEADESRA